MQIMLIADGRSPITQRWIRGLLALQHEVVLVSTFPCAPIFGVSEMHVLPVAFAGLAGSQAENKRQSSAEPASEKTKLRKSIARFRSLYLAARYRLGALTVRYYSRKLQKIVDEVQPDLVHALRIPFEGMLGAFLPPSLPFVVSIWGNDLTLHAYGSRWMKSLTQRTLNRANGLMADAQRDLRLARLWGFPADNPSLVVPGSGGIDLVEIAHSESENELFDGINLPQDTPLVINPRGFRPGSVRNEVFFQAVPLVLERIPNVLFVCPAMAGQAEALQWVKKLKIEKNVLLLPYLSQFEVWKLFRRAQVSVSISSHDGTPNSLLEAMACGCFPIAGDIESLREWITPGVNGLLVEPDKPQALAEAILLALETRELQSEAAQRNARLIRERAEVNYVRGQIEVFYERVLNKK